MHCVYGATIAVVLPVVNTRLVCMPFLDSQYCASNNTGIGLLGKIGRLNNTYECTIDQELTGAAASSRDNASFSLTGWQHITFLYEMMPWPPFVIMTSNQTRKPS